ncbi:MAG: hypothetical protein KIT83_03050 [Bryobacterales bacterium]|nr:hypothetical protein [Bryobacterales bacterium]
MESALFIRSFLVSRVTVRVELATVIGGSFLLRGAEESPVCALLRKP